MQWHGTLAYIENTITGNLDKQQQSMATNQTPVIWRKDDKQSSSTSAQKRQSKHQYLAQKATNQEPVLSTICIHTNTFTGSLLSFFLLSSNRPGGEIFDPLRISPGRPSCIQWHSTSSVQQVLAQTDLKTRDIAILASII
jgi:hypothetical protein